MTVIDQKETGALQLLQFAKKQATAWYSWFHSKNEVLLWNKVHCRDAYIKNPTEPYGFSVMYCPFESHVSYPIKEVDNRKIFT